MALERGIAAVPEIPQRPLVERIQSALSSVFEGTEEELRNVRVLAERLERIVEHALGPHVERLHMHAGAYLPGAEISPGWDVLRERPDFDVIPGLSTHFVESVETGFVEPLETGFVQVLPSIIDIALVARDPEGTAWHEVAHVFENVVATNAELDVLHEETDSIRPEVGKARGLVSPGYRRAGCAWC
jgi:hypothetical protein